MKKHNIVTVSCILCITLFLSACGGSKYKPRQHPWDVRSYDTKEEYYAVCPERDPLFETCADDYIVHEWTEEQTGISRPYGICVVEDGAYVCDFDNSCVVKLDKEGNPIASYGEKGTKAGCFSHPTAIVSHDGELYVLDQGNYRIQIFDMDMQYLREESYRPLAFSKTDYFHDMAIDKDGTIFISVWTNFYTYAVYYLADGKLVSALPKISGVLAEYQGNVYAMNTYVYENFSDGSSLMSDGEHFFLTCSTEGLEVLANLPYGYSPGDFCIVDDMIYAVSLQGYARQIDRITMDGKLDSAIYIFEEKERDWSNIANEPVLFPFYLDVVDDDHIYAVDSLWKTVYYFEKK